MQVETPYGTTWHVQDVVEKLARRAALPGAALFDRATVSLRSAKARGVSLEERFYLALPASWLVNSPAISRVLRRWAAPPYREVCLELLDVLDEGPAGWSNDPQAWAAIPRVIDRLGDEPYVVEALSKVCALLVSEAVPLMPLAARAFVLGPDAPGNGAAFVRIVEWFAASVATHEVALVQMARDHRDTDLTAGAVLDRLLWYDSEGHRHFPEPGAPSPTRR